MQRRTVWTDDTLLARQIALNREAEAKDGVRRHFQVGWEEVAQANPTYGRHVQAQIERLGEHHPIVRMQYLLQTVAGIARPLPPLHRQLGVAPTELQQNHQWRFNPRSVARELRHGLVRQRQRFRQRCPRASSAPPQVESGQCCEYGSVQPVGVSGICLCSPGADAGDPLRARGAQADGEPDFKAPDLGHIRSRKAQLAMITVAELSGLARSFWMYYKPGQIRRMELLYSQFISPSDVAFDIGAHVGSRTLAWSRLGARVVAVEPLPHAMRVLRLLFGRSARVTLVPAAVGTHVDRLPLFVSTGEPTVSTLSKDWANRMRRERYSFANTRWERSIDVPVTTLDALIAEHGQPAFCKIDTEGYELPVLQGLSRPLRCLSFEYVPPALDLVVACLQHLSTLGPYVYNWSIGESMQLHWPDWVDDQTLLRYLAGLPAHTNPGDVYARLIR